MFSEIKFAPKTALGFLESSGQEIQDALFDLSERFNGFKFVHINSTAIGGGVAEILQSLIPFSRSIGINAEWWVLNPPATFFKITKKIHNLLQGQGGSLSNDEWEQYNICLRNAALQFNIPRSGKEIWFFHDPQILPLATYLPKNAMKPIVWVCHPDLSTPNKSLAKLLEPLSRPYDLLIFSRREYVPEGWGLENVHIVSPAIDSSTRKNTLLDTRTAKLLIAEAGLDSYRPLITQVSRLDPWKDPWGVIDVYRKVKIHHPEVQLALLGIAQAADDPEFESVLASVQEYSLGDTDIHIIWDPHQWNDKNELIVNALQCSSDVVLQKSIREGFGLTVTEAMWKGAAVVAGNVGGIRDQIENGISGFLVNNIDECVEKVLLILDSPSLRANLGRNPRESVQRKFLMPRLLRDYLTITLPYINAEIK